MINLFLINKIKIMTPKEKAEELFSKYATYVVMWAGDSNTTNQNCKQCALIAVEQILNSDPNNLHSDYDYNECKLGVDVKYWEQVEQEIEKL